LQTWPIVMQGEPFAGVADGQEAAASLDEASGLP
jgi:hypothetical protein